MTIQFPHQAVHHHSSPSYFRDLFANTSNEEYQNYDLAQMNDLCRSILHESEYSRADPHSFEQLLNIAYSIIATLSIIGLLIVALSIYQNKQLGQHPSPLIANICLVEAIMCYNSLMTFLTPKYMVCYLNAYTTLGMSTK